jgi:hypothetical protein
MDELALGCNRKAVTKYWTGIKMNLLVVWNDLFALRVRCCGGQRPKLCKQTPDHWRVSSTDVGVFSTVTWRWAFANFCCVAGSSPTTILVCPQGVGRLVSRLP